MSDKVCMTVWNHFITDARVTKEAKTLSKHGKHVTVIAILDPKHTPKHEVKDGFRVYRFTRLLDRVKRKREPKIASPTRSPRTVQSGSTVRSLGRNFLQPLKVCLRKIFLLVDKGYINACFFYAAWKAKADVYHAHDLNTALPAYIAARLRRAKYIYDAHEISTDRVGWKNKKWWALIEKRIVRNADGFITTNTSRADFFRKAYGVDRVTVIRNVPEYKELQGSNRIREELGMAPHIPVILYQGGLQPDRGLEMMVDIMRDIQDAVMVFIGDGKLRPALEEKIARHRLGNRVKLLGRVSLEELLSYTASATIGLQLLRNTCLNHYTACSNKLYEYLMAELPVVASDFPELRKVVVGENVGVVVNPDDRDAVIDGIRTLLRDQALYNECKKNARKAKHKYQWSLEESQLVSLYQDVQNQCERVLLS